MLAFLGAEIILTPAAQGMKGSIATAEELVRTTPNAVMRNSSKTSPIPKFTAAPGEEIWNDTGGNIDFFVAGVGTGAHHHRRRTGPQTPEKPSLRVIASRARGERCCPAGSIRCLQGPGHRRGLCSGDLDRSVIDEIVKIDSSTAIEIARALAPSRNSRRHFLRGRDRGGAQIGKRPEAAGKTILAIVPSFSERYLSTALFEEILIMADQPRRPRTLNDARTEAEAASGAHTKVPETPRRRLRFLA